MNWWEKLFADLFASKEPAWVPTYEPQAYVTTTMGDGTTVKVPIAIDYLVTAETAEHLRAKYCPNGKVIEAPFEGAGGPNASNAVMRELQWPNGVTIIAGFLAGIWTRNAAHADVANSLCLAAIAARGAA